MRERESQSERYRQFYLLEAQCALRQEHRLACGKSHEMLFPAARLQLGVNCDAWVSGILRSRAP
jgi:hypothetical protein